MDTTDGCFVYYVLSNVHCARTAAKVRASNYIKFKDGAEFNTSTKNSNMPCACCVDVSYYVSLLSMHVTECSTFSMVQ